MSRKTVYQHNMHVQMWIYMSNPHLVVEFFRKYAHDMRNTPLRYYKKFVYDKFFSHTKDIMDLSISDYCFACYAANIDRVGNNGCGFCPIFTVYERCTDPASLYRFTEVNMEDLYQAYVECELGIQGLSENPKFMENLFVFCNYCQHMAFHRLNPDMKDEYVLL